MTQLREHRDDALEKLDPLGIARCGDQLANLQDSPTKVTTKSTDSEWRRRICLRTCGVEKVGWPGSKPRWRNGSERLR
jgi:hypothetical protein